MMIPCIELVIHWTAIINCDWQENCSKSAGFKTGLAYSLLTPNPVESNQTEVLKTWAVLDLFPARGEHFASYLLKRLQCKMFPSWFCSDNITIMMFWRDNRGESNGGWRAGALPVSIMITQRQHPLPGGNLIFTGLRSWCWGMVRMHRAGRGSINAFLIEYMCHSLCGAME